MKTLIKLTLSATYIALCVFGVVGWYFTHARIGDVALAVCGFSVLIIAIGGIGLAHQLNLIKGE